MRLQTTFVGASLLVNIGIGVGVFLASGAKINLPTSILLFSYVTFCILFARNLYKSGSSPIQFAVLIYFGYAFVLPGLYQAGSAVYFWPSNVLGYEFELAASLIVFFAAISMILSEYIRPGAGSIYRKKRLELNHKKSSNAALLLSLLSLTYSLFLLWKYGPGLFFVSRGAVGGLIESSFGGGGVGFGLVKTLVQGVAIGALIVSSYLYFNSKDEGSNRKYSIAFLLAVASNFIVNFPLAVPRFYLVAVVFVITFSVFYDGFRKYKALLGCCVPIVMFLIFPLLGRLNRTEEINKELELVSFSEYLAHGDLDGFQSLMNAIYLVSVDGVSFGNGIFSALLFFIPRSLWTSKELPTGQAAAELAGYHFTNISMPFPGELYTNFGYLGVLVGMYMFMSFVKKMDSYYNERSGGVEKAMLCIALAAYMPILFRGSILSTIQGFLCSLFAILIWSLLRKFVFPGLKNGR